MLARTGAVWSKKLLTARGCMSKQATSNGRPELISLGSNSSSTLLGG